MLISNKEMKDLIKKVTVLENSDLVIKDSSETIENEAKEQIDAFFGILLSSLASMLVANLLVGKRVRATQQGR